MLDGVALNAWNTHLICSKCKHHDFQKYGYYTRKVKYRKHSVTLRILCVKCTNCKSTHALLLYFYCSLLSLYAKPSSNISNTNNCSAFLYTKTSFHYSQAIILRKLYYIELAVNCMIFDILLCFNKCRSF